MCLWFVIYVMIVMRVRHCIICNPLRAAFNLFILYCLSYHDVDLVVLSIQSLYCSWVVRALFSHVWYGFVRFKCTYYMYVSWLQCFCTIRMVDFACLCADVQL